MLDSETATTSHGTATRIRARVEKHDFSASYDQPTPAAYYRSLQDLDYRLPELARPIIERYLDAIRQERKRDVVRVIDLCSGYGVNAALWNHRIEMEALYRRYAAWPDAGDPAQEVIEDDRRLFAACRRQPLEAEVIGIDVAANALAYAREAGLLAHALPINLEREDPSWEERSLLSQADLVTVTGGLSYIGHKSFERLLACFPRERLPWIVWFPLRHLDVDPVVAALDRFGLQSTTQGTLPQRRFMDSDERQAVVRQLRQRGLDPKDTARGYSHAICRVSRPGSVILSCPDVMRPIAGSSEGRRAIHQENGEDKRRMPGKVIKLDSRRRSRRLESGVARKAGRAPDLWRHPIDLDLDLTAKLLRGLAENHRLRLEVFARQGARVSFQDLLAVTGDSDLRVLSYFQGALTRKLRRLLDDREKRVHLIGWDYASTRWNDARTEIVDGICYVTEITRTSLMQCLGDSPRGLL